MSVSNDGYERFERMTMNAGNTCEISAATQTAIGTAAIIDGAVCLGKPRTGAGTDQFAELNGSKIVFHNGLAPQLNDYDARIICSGMANGNGQANLTLNAELTTMSGEVNFAAGVSFNDEPGEAESILLSAGPTLPPVWLAADPPGAILIVNAAGNVAWLPAGTYDQILKVGGDGIPVWGAAP